MAHTCNPCLSWYHDLLPCMYCFSQVTVSVNYSKEPVLLIASRIMRHAKLCLSMIMFLICVCWHPERMCSALSTGGQRRQV